MRKIFTILAALLTLGIASVNAGSVTIDINDENGATRGEIWVPGGSYIYNVAVGGAVELRNGIYFRIKNTSYNLITSVVCRIKDVQGGGTDVEANFGNVGVYDSGTGTVTISDINASCVVFTAYTGESGITYIDQVTVNYEDRSGTKIMLNNVPETPTWESGNIQITTEDGYVTPVGVIFDSPSMQTLTISTKDGSNLPDLICVFENYAPAVVDKDTSIVKDLLVIKNIGASSVVLGASTGQVIIGCVIIGGNIPGGSTPSGSTEQVDVIYQDKEEVQLNTEEITLHLPAAPEITGFTFSKWVVIASELLVEGIIIRAAYTENTPTNAPVVTVPGNPAQKLVREGNIYILQDDKLYNMHGQRVK